MITKKNQTVKFEGTEVEPSATLKSRKTGAKLTGKARRNKKLEVMFTELLDTFDFITIVMYEELRARRDFIHDCFLIAQATQSNELMSAITQDPHFYVTRDDMFELLRSENHAIISRLLEMSCKYLITEDKGYYLV